MFVCAALATAQETKRNTQRFGTTRLSIEVENWLNIRPTDYDTQLDRRFRWYWFYYKSNFILLQKSV
jgi:hypothetical protein